MLAQDAARMLQDFRGPSQGQRPPRKCSFRSSSRLERAPTKQCRSGTGNGIRRSEQQFLGFDSTRPSHDDKVVATYLQFRIDRERRAQRSKARAEEGPEDSRGRTPSGQRRQGAPPLQIPARFGLSICRDSSARPIRAATSTSGKLPPLHSVSNR